MSKNINQAKTISKHFLPGKGNVFKNIFVINNVFIFKLFAFNILLPLLGGIVISFLTKSNLYEVLNKPFFSPPPIVFKIIWPTLYILMGIASYRINIRNKYSLTDNGAYFSYLIQLFFNFMWSFIFFTFRLYGIAFFWSVILFLLIIKTFLKFKKVDKTASFLLIPYILWIFCVQILSYFIWMLNEM